jgi:hypothetical protein
VSARSARAASRLETSKPFAGLGVVRDVEHVREHFSRVSMLGLLPQLKIAVLASSSQRIETLREGSRVRGERARRR